ncbi:hypothetical protein C8034_v000293 [Colletotrichum sidae]|uniref:Uncharacterized protein n=1 Tax=Colletotrichum sidae TaxID=1347389 RepID=A0A4R8TGG2_9PEZI|nr:hypothetical protein C8034_v000293 [Colletotrichum sidae]
MSSSTSKHGSKHPKEVRGKEPPHDKAYRDLQKFHHAYAQTQTLDAKAELIQSELQKVYDGKRSRAILWRTQHPHLKMFRRDLDEELQPIEGRRCLAVDSARRKVEKKKAKLGKVAQTIADRCRCSRESVVKRDMP